LAGPGIVRHKAVPGLHDLAVSAGIGVLNTWGAKGVFDWRSRHHLATIGLQADDFVLSGLHRADLIIATGLDPHESPDERWRLAPALMVPPAGLAPLAERCGPSPRTSWAMPALRSRLADVTQRGWGVESTPLPPSRVTMHYAECVAAGALVAADAGAAGFWVARTLGTTRLGAVIVPSTSSPGFAAACVAASLLRHPGRPALAVIDLADAEATKVIVDAASVLGIRVPVEAWDPDGDRLDADAHRERLRRMVIGALPAEGTLCTLATDPRQLSEMIEAAGPIVAWT
jgi:thiamine pyrophosphate-dependent acetolactate synthase large subunit-like protein